MPRPNFQFSILLWRCIVICLILYSCANEKAPEGGKKDTVPAKAVKMKPPNKTLHFKADKIEITFNKFIKATGFAQTVMQPAMDKKPTFTIRNKTLIIKLKGPLRDSTTYTINFADDIKDVNEGNVTTNFTYVFSTGSYIDSQRVSGTVILAKDNSPQEGVVVALYPQDSVNGILYAKPFYFVKTDKSGQFHINNVHAAKYWIYALKDDNYNYKYDLPTEDIAFSDSILDLTDTIPKRVELHLFNENRGKLVLDGVDQVAPGHLSIAYSKPLDKFKLNSPLVSDSDFFYFNETGDTVNYWYARYYQQKAHLFLVANDTLVDSTRIDLKFISPDSLIYSDNPAYLFGIANNAVSQVVKNKPDSSAIINNTYSNTTLGTVPPSGTTTAPAATTTTTIIPAPVYNPQELYKPVTVRFTRPVDSINPAKQITVRNDSTKAVMPFKFELNKRTHISISGDFDKTEGTPYTLEIPDSTFRDIFGLWNRRLRFKFQTNLKEDYGNIHLTMTTKDSNKHYIVKLLNSNDVVVAEIPFSDSTEKKADINNVLAGNYHAIVVDDRNNNGKWDTGNFTAKKQPEKIYTIKDTYVLRGGWDLDVDVKF